VGSPTLPTPHTEYPNAFSVVVLVVGTVTGEPTNLPAVHTELFGEKSKPVQKDFIKAIVRTPNVDYYYCSCVGEIGSSSEPTDARSPLSFLQSLTYSKSAFSPLFSNYSPGIYSIGFLKESSQQCVCS
jgi:hypothetical protein